MKWSQVLELSGWLSLKALANSPEAMGDDIVKLHDDMYALTLPYNEHLEISDPANPHAGAVLWAPTDGAARRALAMDVESDHPVSSMSPPDDLAAHLLGSSYGEIKANAMRTGTQMNERASYRIARDGRFVYKAVEAGNVTYFFRKRRGDLKEKPFAISIALPSARTRSGSKT
jgi:hypothetical protein